MAQTVLLTSFPDIGQNDTAARKYFASVYKANIIFLSKAKAQAYAEHPGPLSIKTTFKGKEFYEFDGARIATTPGSFLLLNGGQKYASEIDSEEEVESCSVFFANGFAEEVLSAMAETSDQLLDNYGHFTKQQVYFFEKLYTPAPAFANLLHRLRVLASAGGDNELEATEILHSLLGSMLWQHRKELQTAEQLPQIKKATRTELYRRLHLAKDMIDSCPAEKLTLQDLANVACLSAHHFLRMFTQAFGISPHKYLVQRRLQQAAALLTFSQLPVQEIGVRVGFDDPAIFSRAFATQYGLSPRSFRQQSRS